jgi:hypothetical protein
MKKKFESFFYYQNYLIKEIKFFFLIFLTFITLSFFHYKFYPYNNYIVEIIFSINKSKIKDFFETERLFKKDETNYFNNENNLYINQVEKIIDNHNDFFDFFFKENVKKNIFQYNKTTRNLSFEISNYYEKKFKYILEINNPNDLDRLRKILNNEIRVFENQILKKINAKLNLISVKIDEMHSNEFENNKIILEVINLIKKEDLLKIFGNDSLERYGNFLTEKIEIEKKNKNLVSLINYFTNHQSKFTDYYIDNYNLNYIDYDIFYKKKDQQFLLKIFLYLFLSFLLTIIIMMLRLSYKYYK